MCSRVLKLIIPLLVGVVVLIVGLILIFVVFPNVIEKEITENVELKEDTLQWYRFLNFPFPFKFSAYLYTIKNKNEVLQGAQPIVQEVGPYVYDEFRTREILDTNNQYVTYNEKWSFTFNQNASGSLTEDTPITVINSPLIAILQNLENPILPIPANLVTQIVTEMFDDTSLFIDVKPRELNFDGIKMCHKDDQSGLTMLMCLFIMIMNQKLLEYHTELYMTFSLFKYKTKPDGPFTLNRGLNDVMDVGLITSYKGMEYTNFWKGEKNQCDKVNGFFTTFPPFIEEDTSLQIYSSDICKPAILNFGGEGEFKEVSTYKFQTNAQSFGSTEDCICIGATKGLQGEEHCFNSAVLDMNTCMGVPVILSFPHMMWAHENYTKTINDTSNITLDRYNTIIDFEPHLGQPVQGSIRLQFNVVLRPIKLGEEILSMTENWPRALFPIVWVDDSFQLTDGLIEEMDTKLFSQLKLADIVQWTVIGIGAVLCLISLILLLCCRKK